MFKDVMTLFTRMSLKPKDTKVYLSCLHHKEGLFVHEIVKETRVNRSTVDVILQRLINLDFINKVKVERRYKYFAQSPETILFKQEEIVNDLRKVMPVLSKLGSQKEETEIRFFEGRDGIRQIYDDMLLRLKFAEGDSRQIVSFVTGTDSLKSFPDMQKQFIDKRIKSGTWYRAIIPHSSIHLSEYSNNPASFRAVKSVDDKKFPFKATFETYADSVMIYSPVKPFGGVVIRNQRIADSMRSLFYLVWGLLPEG